MFELVAKVISSNNLNTSDVLDKCYAICLADRFIGTNRLGLDCRKFSNCNGDADWEKVLSLLGVPKQSHGGMLPEVQRYRVITDALVICLGKTGSDCELSSEASSKVANILGLHARSRGYKDINEVKSILTQLVRETYDFSEIVELENSIKEYENYFRQYKVDFGNIIRKALADFTLPAELSYVKYGDMTCSDVEEAVEIFKERVIFALEYEIVNFLRKYYDRDPVRVNLFLNRALKEVGNIGLGTVSMRNYAPALEYESGLCPMIRSKLDRIFSQSMNYSYDDLSVVVTMLKHLYTGKVGNKYGIQLS